jgi:hypothetical protein
MDKHTAMYLFWAREFVRRQSRAVCRLETHQSLTKSYSGFSCAHYFPVTYGILGESLGLDNLQRGP